METPRSTSRAQPASPLFAVRGVSQERAGRVILRDLTLDLPRTEITALIGPSGAGKTAATSTATRRRRGKAAPGEQRALWGISGTAMLLSSGLTLAYVAQVVLHVRPWYDPRYIIPLFGMIVGNAMNGAALAAERLASEMESRRGEVEAYLALGVAFMLAGATAMTATVVVRWYRRTFFTAASQLAVRVAV